MGSLRGAGGPEGKGGHWQIYPSARIGVYQKSRILSDRADKKPSAQQAFGKQGKGILERERACLFARAVLFKQLENRFSAVQDRKRYLEYCEKNFRRGGQERIREGKR